MNTNSLTFSFQVVYCSQSNFKLFNDSLSKCQPDHSRGLTFSCFWTFHQHASLMCRKRGGSEEAGLRFGGATTITTTTCSSLSTTRNRQRCISSRRIGGSEDWGQRTAAAAVEADSGARGQRACSCKHDALDGTNDGGREEAPMANGGREEAPMANFNASTSSSSFATARWLGCMLAAS